MKSSQTVTEHTLMKNTDPNICHNSSELSSDWSSSNNGLIKLSNSGVLNPPGNLVFMSWEALIMISGVFRLLWSGKDGDVPFLQKQFSGIFKLYDE